MLSRQKLWNPTLCLSTLNDYFKFPPNIWYSFKITYLIQFVLLTLFCCCCFFLFRDIVLKLLQYEASTNVADNKGYFPIHLAAWKGDVEIVKILIHHGPSHSRVNEQVHLPNVCSWCNFSSFTKAKPYWKCDFFIFTLPKGLSIAEFPKSWNLKNSLVFGYDVQRLSWAFVKLLC